MELKCENCGDIFMSNALLYKHKQIAHANLCTSSNSPISSITAERKRSTTDDSLKQSKLLKIELKSNMEDNFNNEMSDKFIDATKTNEINGEEIQIIDNQLNGKSCNASTNSTDHTSLGAGRSSESKFQSKNEQTTFKTEQLHDDDLIRIMESVYRTQIVQKLEHNIMNLRQKHKIEIAEIRQKCNASLKEMEMQLEKEKSIHAWEIAESASDDDDDNDKEILSTLTKAINNAATMKQVYEIQRLMEEGQINEILKKHFITFKNVLQSLTYGIIPLCQSQRDQVTNSQRNLVQQLQFSTKPTAVKLLKGRHSEIIKLFLIVKDSIKLIRNSYNKYRR